MPGGLVMSPAVTSPHWSGRRAVRRTTGDRTLRTEPAQTGLLSVRKIEGKKGQQETPAIIQKKFGARVALTGAEKLKSATDEFGKEQKQSQKD